MRLFILYLSDLLYSFKYKLNEVKTTNGVQVLCANAVLLSLKSGGEQELPLHYYNFGGYNQ